MRLSPTARLAELAFWLAIMLWVSAILTAGVSAAFAFPTMHEFEVVVPKFAAYDRSEHWSIAAGLLMERMFFVTDIAQLVFAVLVLLGLGVGLSAGGRSLRRPIEIVRTCCILGAVLVLAYRVFMLAPAMNRSLHTFWDAAEQGETEVAAKCRAEFQADHPIAGRLYGVTLVLLLVAAGATAWSPPRPRVIASTLADGLQEPALLRKAPS